VNPWRTSERSERKRARTITGLTPGTTYAIQVRALGGSTGSGDWSDTVTRICV